MTDKDEALTFAGLEGCASSREYYWHLAVDNEEQWNRFPMVSSWKWMPGSDCNAREFGKEEMVRDLVEQGGWLILGGMYYIRLCLCVNLIFLLFSSAI